MTEIEKRWKEFNKETERYGRLTGTDQRHILADEYDIIKLLCLKDIYEFRGKRERFIVAVDKELNFIVSDIDYDDEETMKYVEWIKKNIAKGEFFEYKIPTFKNGNYNFSKPALVETLQNLVASSATKMEANREEELKRDYEARKEAYDKEVSMELTDEVLEALAVNKGMSLSEMFDEMIFGSGNSEELVMRVTGLDPYYLELFFTYIINAVRVSEVIYLNDVPEAKHAVKILGKEVHYKPFRYLATHDYFGEEDYRAIVDVLWFVQKMQEEEVDEDE